MSKWFQKTVKKPIVVMGIETSCDDTCCSVVNENKIIEGDYISSQIELHKKFGGIYPNEAKRAHKQHIEIAINSALQQSGRSWEDLSGLAVTIGPGLAPCLTVGLEKAKYLSKLHNLPLIPINHLEAHCLMTRLTEEDLEFPFLVLLVSGGHTQLLVCQNVDNYVQLGSCMDDSLGEAFDKVLRVLDRGFYNKGKEYQGVMPPLLENSEKMHPGNILEILARNGNPKTFPLPEPLLHQKNCDFSYAGIKTAVLRTTKKVIEEQNSCLTIGQVSDIAASFQAIAVKHLLTRTERAIKWTETNVPDCKTLVVSGGVARNEYLRDNFSNFIESKEKWKILFPPPQLCTDNGVMVAWSGIEKLKCGFNQVDIEEIGILPKWPLDRSIIKFLV